MGRNRPDDRGFLKDPKIMIGPVIRILVVPLKLSLVLASRLPASGGYRLEPCEREQKTPRHKSTGSSL
jgi:hypothetical protein